MLLPPCAIGCEWACGAPGGTLETHLRNAALSDTFLKSSQEALYSQTVPHQSLAVPTALFVFMGDLCALTRGKCNPERVNNSSACLAAAAAVTAHLTCHCSVGVQTPRGLN